jgi:hypothetical protein
MTYAWIEIDGRKLFRDVTPKPRGPRSDLARPMLIRDFSEPVRSAANGKYYTSKRDLAASHRASGNPHGIDFVELGNEEQKFVPYVADKQQRRDDIRQAKADFEAGWRPDVVTLDD